MAVLNAGHGATAAILLAGEPALLVPIHLEQGLLARAAVRNTGAALEASYTDGEDATAKLETILSSDKYPAAARAFAAKHADFDPRGTGAAAGEGAGRGGSRVTGAWGAGPARERVRSEPGPL